jgi:DNA invertase Pin-like site-specific DNA recombinase
VPRAKTPSAAAIYCRISSDPDETRLGVARQEQDCRELAERKGWPVAKLYVDNDISAAGSKRRPAYAELLEAIEFGAIDAVITWDLDRLHRRPIELEEFFAVCDKAGVHQLASVGGDVDLSTGEGMLVARIKGAVAAEEIAKIRRRSQRKKLEMAERGLPPGGGRRPFGFAEDRITHVPEEAEAIRDWARRVIAGEPLRAVVRDLNTLGPSTVFGGIWRANALWKVLTAPRTAGLREYHGEIIGDAAWQPILDRTTWERVRRILTDPNRRTNTEARKYLLSGGIARCGRCGQVMVGRPHHSSTPAYRCRLKDEGGCNGTVINAEPLEEFVVAAVMQALDTPKLAQAGKAKRELSTPDDEAVIIEAEAQLEELAQAWGAKEITRSEWMAARKAIEARLVAAQRRVAAVSSSAALAAYGDRGVLRAAWPELTMERKRAVIAAVIDRVTIGPARPGYNKFDPNRLAITWKV